jgi:hypothetical protein
MTFHAGFAKAARAPCQFRFLNSLEPLSIGHDPVDGNDENYDRFIRQLKYLGGGGTPLCKHLQGINADLQLVRDELREKDQNACIVIATDGQSTDGNIIEYLRPFQQLPCWVIVHLYTNDKEVVEYWNNVDKELEFNLDVLHHFTAEAKEIHKLNPWLLYGEPLHRMREFGVSIRELDTLDEKEIAVRDLPRFVKLL